MRPFQSTTEARLPAFLQQVSRWPLALRHLHERVATYFVRAEPRRHALLYLQAVLSDIPRKNGWQIAEYARQLRPYGMQRLLSRAVWDQDGVRAALLRVPHLAAGSADASVGRVPLSGADHR